MAEESNLDKKVEKYILSKGGWFIKYWAGPKYTKDGIPDILACINGKFYGIEDKAHNGRPKLLQLINLSKIRNAGGIGLLLYPKDFENFKKFINDPKKNEDWYIKNIAIQYEWIDKLQK